MRHLFSTCVAATVLVACGGIQPAANVVGRVPQTDTIFTNPHQGGSWMKPEAKRENLVYLSLFVLNAVYVYDYNTGAQVGELTGFDTPSGQCVDKEGDVWIANLKGFSVVEYAHGGTTPIATLKSEGAALGCSIDPTTGNLAVVNFSYGYGTSSVQVWKGARGKGNILSNPRCGFMWSPGYDPKGNLYVECEDKGPPGYVYELKHGGNKLTRLSIDRGIGAAAGVMWDGKYISLTVQPFNGENATQIYQVVEKTSGHLTVVNVTDLKDHCWHHTNFVGLIQPFIVGTKNTPENGTQGKVVVGGNRPCRGRFDYWRYTAGGQPTSALKSVPSYVGGQAVSLAVH